MSGRYKSSYCYGLVGNYISKIEEKKEAINKNFIDMDFENADARDEFEDLKNNMIKQCDSLIQAIRSYNFQ